MHHMTHCVSASDARALTQMDTNTAGTPKISREKKDTEISGVIIHCLLCM